MQSSKQKTTQNILTKYNTAIAYKVVNQKTNANYTLQMLTKTRNMRYWVHGNANVKKISIAFVYISEICVSYDV